MKDLLKNKNFIIKLGLLILFFVLGYLYERPQDARQLYLILLSLPLVGGLILSSLVKGFKKQILCFVIMLLSVLFIEGYSAYVMNYFFHLLYLIILIDILLSLPIRMSWMFGGLVVILSLKKYLYLYAYQKRPETLAEIIFFVLMTSIIFIASSFSRYYQDEKNEKEKLYRQMLGQNEALRLYSEKVADHSVNEERTRIARELHDQLGHKLTGLVMELEMIDHLMGQNTSKEKTLLIQAKEDARGTLKLVRSIVEQYNETDDEGTEDELVCMIEAFMQRSFLQVDYINDLSQGELPWTLIYQLVRESLTNAARYSKEGPVVIKLSETHETYELSVFNPGIYNDPIKIGNGIKGMRERLKVIKGSLAFNQESGFEIKCTIPKESKNDKNFTR